MDASNEMNQAIYEFEKIIPRDCEIHRWAGIPRPIRYTLVKIDGWPWNVHYEFRFTKKEGLFVELHIEDEKHLHVRTEFKRIAETNRTILGHKLEYFEKRSYPNIKKRPSLSIRVGRGVIGCEAAEIMRELINKTKGSIQLAIGL